MPTTTNTSGQQVDTGTDGFVITSEQSATPTASGSFTPIAPPSAVQYSPVTAAPAVGYSAAQVGPAVTYDAAQVGPAVGYDPTKVEAETYKATTGTAQQAGATTRTVQNDELVRNQLTTILDDYNSPIQKRAQARSQAYMAARGGQNSTMAAQAGTAALIDAAMPIAQADAAAYQTAARDNQTWLNNVAMFNVSQANSMEQFNVSETNTSLRFNADSINAARQFNANADNRAKEFFATQQNENNRFNVTATNTQRSQFAQDQNANNRFNTGETNAARQFSAAETNATNRFNAGQINQAGIANASETNRVNMSNFSASEQRIIQSNAQAASIYNQYLAGVANIQQNPNLDGPARATALNNLTDATRGGLSMIGAGAGQDYGDYLTFTAAAPISEPDMTGPGTVPGTSRTNPGYGQPVHETA